MWLCSALALASGLPLCRADVRRAMTNRQELRRMRRYGTMNRPVRTNGNLLQNPQPVGPVPWGAADDIDSPNGVFWVGESREDGASPIGPNGPWPQYGAALPVVTRAISLLADPLTAGVFRVRKRAAGNPAGDVIDTPRWMYDPQLARPDGRVLGVDRDSAIPAPLRRTRAKFWRDLIEMAITHGRSFVLFTETASGEPQPGTLWLVNPETVDRNDAGNWEIDGYDFDRNGRGIVRDENGDDTGVRSGRLVELRNPHHRRGVFVAHPEAFRIGGRIQGYTQGIFRSGIPAGFLKVNNPNLSQAQADALKAAWMSAHGSSDQRTIAVLNATVDFTPVALSPVNTALAEVSRLNIADVAMAFNIAPETLGVTLGNSATYSNVSQWFEAHRDFSLTPWIAALQDFLSALLPLGQDAEVNLDAMAAPPLEDRMRAWQTAISAGVLTVNEVRAREGLPPLPEKEPEPVPPALAEAAAALEAPSDAPEGTVEAQNGQSGTEVGSDA